MIFGKKNSPEQPPPNDMDLLKSVLLVVDGSDPSIAAAEFAVKLAKQVGSEITAMNVVDTETMQYLTNMHIFVEEERQEFERDLENTGKRYLDYVIAIAGKNGIEIETIQRKGSFNKMILEEARNLNVDAIIIGGWKRSVTRKDAPSVERQLVLDGAECPVIVIMKPGVTV